MKHGWFAGDLLVLLTVTENKLMPGAGLRILSQAPGPLSLNAETGYVYLRVLGTGASIMTTFHEREQAFEAKFAHDEQFRFLVTARRDKLFARWAAVLLKSSAQAATELTESVLAVRGGNDHDALLLKLMAKSLSEHDKTVSEAQLAVALSSCAVEARQQLLDQPFS